MTPPQQLPPTGDITVSLRLTTRDDAGCAVGDLFSQYDPVSRRGAALSVISHNGGPASGANQRNLSFYLDDGSAPRWSFAGRPQDCRWVFTLAIYRGRLFGGIYVPAGRGRLVEHVAPDQWIDRGETPNGANGVQSSAVHRDQLFVATGCYDGTGSGLLPIAPNRTPGGNIYRVDDDFRWHDCGNPFAHAAHWVNQSPALLSFGDRLYLASSFHPDLFVYEGDQRWSRVPSPPMAMCVLAGYQGRLFAAPKSLKPDIFPGAIVPPQRGPLYVLGDDSQWVRCGEMPGAERIYCMAVHDNQLFAGSWIEGRTHRCANGIDPWIDAGTCGAGPLHGYNHACGEIMAMGHYHGQLYVGSLPFAEVFRYDGDHHWTTLGRLDETPGVPIRRVWTCALYDGGLYLTTLPRGEVIRLDAGIGVTDPHPLAPGTCCLAAVRRGDELALYRDGRRIAARRDPRIRSLNIHSPAPFRTGQGPYAALHGSITDLRIQPRALNDAEITALAPPSPSVV